MTNWLWLYFMARIWSPATQCGARSLWQGRAGLGQTGHFLCQHPNILLGAKPFRWSGKTWNFYNILWDQTSIVCMFSETNISYRADRPKLCFGQTCWQDILFKKGNGTNYVFLICKQTQDDPESSQIRWKNKLSQTHWQIPLATFSHFPQNHYLSILLWLIGSISSPEI